MWIVFLMSIFFIRQDEALAQCVDGKTTDNPSRGQAWV